MPKKAKMPPKVFEMMFLSGAKRRVLRDGIHKDVIRTALGLENILQGRYREC